MEGKGGHLGRHTLISLSGVEMLTETKIQELLAKTHQYKPENETQRIRREERIKVLTHVLGQKPVEIHNPKAVQDERKKVMDQVNSLTGRKRITEAEAQQTDDDYTMTAEHKAEVDDRQQAAIALSESLHNNE